MNATPLTRIFLVLTVAFLLTDFGHTQNRPPNLGDTPRAKTDTGITDETAAGDIPIQLDPIHIFLELKVNGKGPFTFALDTGASSSAVSTRTAKEVGLATFGNIDVSGAGEKKRTAQMARGVNFELPGVVLAKQTVIAVNLDDFEMNKGHRVDGILGFEFFNNFIVEIDYEASRLRVFDPKKYRHDGKGKIIPMTISPLRVPQIHATVNLPGGKEITGNFLLDIGAALQVNFMKPFVSKNDVAKTIKTKIATNSGYGIGGKVKSIKGRIVSLNIGGLQFKQPIISMSQATKGIDASEDYAGYIGGEILGRCNVTFDYQGNRLILQPNKNFESTFEIGMLGVKWKTGGRGSFHDFQVDHVRPGSAADQAGVKPGDRLIEFNGVKHTELTNAFLHRNTRKPGTTIHLIMKRGEEAIELKIKLVRRI